MVIIVSIILYADNLVKEKALAGVVVEKERKLESAISYDSLNGPYFPYIISFC